MAGIGFLLCLVVTYCRPIGRLLPSSCGGELSPRHRPENPAAFFIFGDSLLDAGNNNYLNDSAMDAGGNPTNEPPYGETFFKHPTGRCSDGRVVPDFIAEKANLPLIPPYLQPGLDNYTAGVNFASAGAGVLPETSAGKLDLLTQLQYFKNVKARLRKQLGDAEADKLVSRAVYLFSMGGNDYMTYYSQSNATDVLKSPYTKIFMNIVLGNLTNVFKGVYDMGGRKFVLQNVGPLGCMPGMKASASDEAAKEDCIKVPTELAKMHNVALSLLFKKLQKQLPGFKYALYDYNTAVAQRTLHAQKFGFMEGKKACCGSGPFRGDFTCGGHGGKVKYEVCSNPSEYVWFDAAHPTESANKQLAELMWGGRPSVIKPYNVKALFAI